MTIPFDGREGEGSELHFYVARPPGVERPPVVMTWGGIDTWKEEMRSRASYLLDLGFAMLLVDMPGIGQSPVLASRDAERQWTPVLDWLAVQDDLDAERVAALGASFGGYWAMKLAYTHRERLRAAVNWGGGVHITFTREWQEKSRNAASYLMDLMAARAAIFGGKTFEDYVERCPELSLLDQGLLDEPSAPLLLVNGRHDLQNATDDIYLSLEHGDPKAARIFPGGHMGEGPTVPTIGTGCASGSPRWLMAQRATPVARGVGHGSRDDARDLAVERARHDVVGVELVLGTSEAIACAAASFIGSLIVLARTSSAPRNTPGKASTLLIWLG